MFEHSNQLQNDDDNVVIPTVTYRITLKPQNSRPWVYSDWVDVTLVRFNVLTFSVDYTN